MLSNEDSVLEEWVLHRKTKSVTLILVSIMLLISWFIFLKPLLNCYAVSEEIKRLKNQSLQLKKMILEREVKIQQRLISVQKMEQSYEKSEELKSSAVWVEQHLRRCGVNNYSCSENNTVPTGGQGRPNFTVTMKVNYAQSLCALSHFYRYSTNWDLVGLLLERDSDKHWLNMKMEIEMKNIALSALK